MRLPIPPRPHLWGERWDLNPRQPESQSGALPTELRPPQTVIEVAQFIEPLYLGLACASPRKLIDGFTHPWRLCRLMIQRSGPLYA